MSAGIEGWARDGAAEQDTGSMNRLTRIDTLIFDVFGTVVDEAGSIAAEVSDALADPALAHRLTEGWANWLDTLMDEVRAGAGPWRSNDDLRRAALHGALLGAEIPALPPTVVDELALVGHRLRPWPDSASALQTLAGAFTVVALSNGTMAQLADVSAVGGLAWHCVLSAELVEKYKPDPAVYRLALDLLDLDPERTLMVAAHPWDLNAAAEHGLRTAYIARPGEATVGEGDDFDVYADDLRDLAERLTTR